MKLWKKNSSHHQINAIIYKIRSCRIIMTRAADLLRRLSKEGILVPEQVKKAILKVDLEHFTDYDVAPFYADRPVPYIESNSGNIKTISAPHMIITLLHHMELAVGQEIIVIGCKGGYLSALIATIVGENGRVNVLDPSTEVVNHAKERLSHWPTVEIRAVEDLEVAPIAFPGEFNRVIMTGQIESIPQWIKSRVCDGGFVIAPLGDIDSQNLMKIEFQENIELETNLGNVCFGPIDLDSNQNNHLNPKELADLIELSIETCEELEIIDYEELHSLQDLVAKLNNLPDDTPPIGEGGIPVSDHPMVKLLWHYSPSFLRLWPIIQVMLHPMISNFDLNTWNRFDDDENIDW